MSKEHIHPKQFQTFDPNILAASEYANDASNDNKELEALYGVSQESYLVNSIISAKIIKKADTNFIVDIGYKSYGTVPFHEFSTTESEEFTIGTTIEVMIEQLETKLGIINLSYEKAKATRSWEKIATLYKDNKPVEGIVTSKVQGGLYVDVGIQVFLPGSQIDIQRVTDFDAWVGKKIQAYIIKLMPKRGNVVISRRKFIHEQRSESRREIIETFKEGQIVQGIVKNITKYGAFIDIGGVDGLLHITDMTWSRIDDQTKFINLGDTVTVKILSFDKDNEKISLGMKQLTDNPWEKLDQNLDVGSKIKGKIRSVKDYGIFVEIIDGVEGLIHISEVSWTDRIQDLTKRYHEGDEIEAMIVALERKNRRMSLSIKQMEKNPWDSIENYEKGQIVKGKITNVADFGFFAQIAPGIDGLVHVSDISWTQHIKNPREMYKQDQEVDVVILDINKEEKKIILSVKELTENPWKTIASKIHVGDMLLGTVSKIVDFGAFVTLKEHNLEAFIHNSECSDEGKDSKEVLEVGKEYLFRLIRISPEEQRIGLSLKKESRHDKKHDKKGYNKENREGKGKDESSGHKDKKSFYKKNQNQTGYASSNQERKSSLHLEIEKMLKKNKEVEANNKKESTGESTTSDTSSEGDV
jgi:small subunit ribosomal protein S1